MKYSITYRVLYAKCLQVHRYGSPWLPLRWRHNDHAGVSNHQPHGCLLNRLFRRKSKKTSKLRVTGLCAGNSPGTGEFPAQMASYAENVSIWWRHHVCVHSGPLFTKRADVLLQDLVKYRSREIRVYTLSTALKFDWLLGSSAAEMPVNKTIRSL